MLEQLHVATNRHVVTYEPNDCPMGFITGYISEAGAFVVEHVVSFRHDILRRMIRTALEGPWPYPYIVIHISAHHPRRGALQRLAEWAGFLEYAPGSWVMYPR